MYNKSIGKVVEKTEIISANLEAITFNSIRKVLHIVEFRMMIDN